jgi:hypothetical protein
MIHNLAERILELDRAVAFEAAQLLASDLGGDPDPEAEQPESPILADPLAHQDDIDDLSRVLLLTAADVDPEAVERALDGAQRRQFVLGGTELVILGLLALEGLRILVTKGATSEDTTVTFERSADGSERVVTSTKRTFGVSKGLASLLRAVLPGGG